MITQLSRFEAQKGKELLAHEALKRMAAAVKTNEPGCLMYAVTRGHVNPLEIYVYAIYQDQPSFDAHNRTDHLRELQKSIDEFLDNSAFNMEMLDEVAGFVREPIVEMTGQMD